MNRVLDSTKTQGSSQDLLSSATTLFAISIVALLARLGSLSYIPESLWHEDGVLLINNAYSVGIESLWLPWAGYHHLYNRIVALIARALPLSISPHVFFLAWVFTFLLIVWQVQSRAKLIGLSHRSQLLLILAIALQPSQGEAFFNLTHADYYLGIALAIYICIPAVVKPTAIENVFLTIASLTGVTAVALVPVLVMQLFTLRDFSVRKAGYIIVPAGAVIQSVCMLLSDRGRAIGINESASDWLHGIGNFLTFGSDNYLLVGTAALFWIVILLLSLRWSFGDVGRSQTLRLIPLYFVLATLGWSALVVVSGALNTGGAYAFSPLDMGSRYFLMPYSLVFFLALIFANDDGKSLAFLAALLATICIGSFSVASRLDRDQSTGLLNYEDMQWAAFVKFQALKPDLLIPINTSMPIYPPGDYVKVSEHSSADPAGHGSGTQPIVLTAPSTLKGEVAGSIEDGPILKFDISSFCVKENYLALEIDLWRERMGWAQVAWGQPADVHDVKTLKRFYPAGDVTMQFAFRRDLSEQEIRIHPALGVRESPIVKFFARARASMPPGPPSNIVIGEPTSPGGKMKINEVRLFCLD